MLQRRDGDAGRATRGEEETHPVRPADGGTGHYIYLVVPPQYRGRIERLWSTFQNRLTSEMRLARASTIREANQVLWEFQPRYSQRFSVPAVQPGSAYRSPEEGFIPDEVFCFKYYRRVDVDNVVCFGGHRLQIEPTNGRASYARARVEVHERMDSSLAVYYQGHCLASRPAPLETPLLRMRNIARIIPGMLDSDKPALPVSTAKKTTSRSLLTTPGPVQTIPGADFLKYVPIGGDIFAGQQQQLS